MMHCLKNTTLWKLSHMCTRRHVQECSWHFIVNNSKNLETICLPVNVICNIIERNTEHQLKQIYELYESVCISGKTLFVKKANRRGCQ